jgi:glycosidase
MKRKKIISFILTLAFCFTLFQPSLAVSSIDTGGDTSVGYSSMSLSEDDTVYMLMTDRFFDGNSSNNGTLGEEYRPGNLHYYQGGDWAGLTQKLQYIKDLGFTAIWISAPQENETYSRSGDEAGYHGYYTKDFNSPNSHFGTEEELNALMAAADALGLKVIIDAQLNHTADYLQYPSTVYDPPDYKPAAPFDNPSWYHNNPNIVDFTDPYEAQNYSLGGLDDLAQENPDCWQALMDAYWKPSADSGWFSYGFAGSRVDAVIEIPPEYLALYEQHTGKPSFGEAFTGSVDENSNIQNYMWGMLDFPLYFQMNNVFCKGEEWGGVKWAFDQDYKYKDTNRLFTFLDNHDRARFLSNASDNWAKQRLALTFQFATRGIPVVYYGTEQNMAGDYRYTEDTINYWNREMMSSFSEDTATFQYIQRLNQLRQEYSDILSKGVQRELYYSYGDAVYAFSRRNDGNGKEIICLFNNSASAQTRTITLNPGTTSFTIGTQLTDLLNTNTVINVQEGSVQNSRIITVTLPANSAVMLTSGYPAEYHQPTYSQTKIIIHFDAGWGNSLSIRGNGEPLNWDSGLKCENVSSNTWQFIIERPLSQALEFKVLLNDTTWESGNNHVVQPNGTIEIWPNF